MSTFAQNLCGIFIARYVDWPGLRHRRPLMLFFRNGGIGGILCILPAAAVPAGREPGAWARCSKPWAPPGPPMPGGPSSVSIPALHGGPASDRRNAAPRGRTPGVGRIPAAGPDALRGHPQIAPKRVFLSFFL
jgi:hypothetical protein